MPLVLTSGAISWNRRLAKLVSASPKVPELIERVLEFSISSAIEGTRRSWSKIRAQSRAMKQLRFPAAPVASLIIGVITSSIAVVRSVTVVYLLALVRRATPNSLPVLLKLKRLSGSDDRDDNQQNLTVKSLILAFAMTAVRCAVGERRCLCKRVSPRGST
jgi:hypothetical protein